jgi:tetratricopeptide (TPR) repeat protein
VSSAIEAVETDRTSHYWLALAYADLGELEAAAEALEKAADELSLALLSATVEPRLAPLRGTEAYARLIERLRLGT